MAFGGWLRPRASAAPQLRIADSSTCSWHCVGVDDDAVAIADERDRPAVLRFRRDVADDEPVRAAGEPAVGEQRHVGAQPGAHDRRRRRQHLRHPRSALWSFVPDHDDVALADLALLEPREHRLFGVVDLGGPSNRSPSFPVIFATEPSGARLPVEDPDVPARQDGSLDG